MNRKNVEVRSLILLRRLFDAGKFFYLHRINSETVNGKIYPVFVFMEGDGETEDMYYEYIDDCGLETDDRSKDDPALWAGYDSSGLENFATCDKINTRNPKVIERLFDAGQAGNLLRCTTKNEKKMYRILSNEVTKTIKHEEDEVSQMRWRERHERRENIYND